MARMGYDEALEFIHSRAKFGPKKGLERIRELMRRLGNPQDDLRYVHVAGSSGKGSTATMCESVMRSAGYKTGLFVSPFVFDFCERIQLNGRPVKKETLAQALNDIMPVIDSMSIDGLEITEFELITALAFVIFKNHDCGIVVLEVGIGGLMDCTNIIAAPEVAVITAVSLDHTEILGKTIGEIAAQKCGIIKPGCKVAAYCVMDKEARDVLMRTCGVYGITPRIADMTRLCVLRQSGAGSAFEYRGDAFELGMAGEHQMMNALTAISACDELRELGWDIPQGALRRGLCEALIPGRLQMICEEPLCVIDGAHNAEKITVLCREIDRLFSGRRLITVMGMMSNKDYELCIPIIARRSEVFIAVDCGLPRALPAAQVGEIASRFCADVRVAASPAEGGKLARVLSRGDTLALGCGSLYIIGDIKLGFIG